MIFNSVGMRYICTEPSQLLHACIMHQPTLKIKLPKLSGVIKQTNMYIQIQNLSITIIRTYFDKNSSWILKILTWLEFFLLSFLDF